MVEKRQSKRPLGKPWRVWEDNIKRDLQGIGCEVGECVEVSQDMVRWWAFKNTAMDFGVP